MIHFLHTFHPQPILFQIGFLSVHWYGLLMSLAAIAGIALAIRLGKLYAISADFIYGLALWVVVGGLFGARLYYVIYNFSFYRENPLEIFSFWHGGLAIYGALLGGLCALYFYARKYRRDFLELCDMLAPSLVLGQIIGRWGNYFNQELFGTPTQLPWGIPIDPANRPAQFADSMFFHPVFLYEGILNLILLILLLWMFAKRSMARGMIFALYLAGYGVIRLSMETMRTDFTPFVFGLRWQALASGIIIMLGLGLAGVQYYKLSSQTE